MAEKLNTTLAQLVSSVSGSEDERVLSARLHWAQRHIAKRHYSAVHAESVHEVYQDGLLERLTVLGRPDLAELLSEKLEQLDKTDYVTAQILLMLKELSMNPETRVSKAAALQIGREKGDDEKERIANSHMVGEIMEGLCDDMENWNTDWAFTEEANAMYLETDGETDEEDTLSLSPASENIKVPNSGADEFRIWMQAIQENGTNSLPDLSGGTVNLELQHFCEQSYWNLKPEPDRPIVISEATAVREVILALRGFPSVFFEEAGETVSVVDQYRVLHFSRSMLVNILMMAAKDVITTTRVRRYVKVSKEPLLQVLDGAIEDLVFKPFYEQLYATEKLIVSSDSTAIITLSSLLNQVQSVTKTWAPILKIIDKVDHAMETTDARQCFAMILNDLYEATKLSTYASVGLQSNPAFTLVVKVFSWCLEYYCTHELDTWMRTSDKIAYKSRFFVQNSELYQPWQSYWTHRYSIHNELVPKFLRPLVFYIYEAGLSVRFLSKIKNEQVEMEQQKGREGGFSFGDAVGTCSKNEDLWWLKLPLKLEKWVLSNHLQNARTLLDCVYDSGMERSLNRYTQLYLMLEEQQPLMADFLERVFARLDKGKDPGGKIDKFVVQEEFESAWAASGLTLTLASTEEPPGMLLAPPQKKQKDAQSQIDFPDQLVLLSRLRLEVPIPWIVQEVVGEHTRVLYQDVWTTLVQWSYVQHAIKTRHLANLASSKSGSGTGNAAELTHAVLVFVNKVMEYMHISVLLQQQQQQQNSNQRAVPGSTGSSEDDGSILLQSFQDLINAQIQFCTAIGLLLFLDTSDAFISNIKAQLDKALVYCFKVGSAGEHDQAHLGQNRDGAWFYESVEYFVTSQVQPLQKAVRLAVANNKFGGNVEWNKVTNGFAERLD